MVVNEQQAMKRTEPELHEAQGVVIRNLGNCESTLEVAVGVVDLLEHIEPITDSDGMTAPLNFDAVLKHIRNIIDVRLETGSW